MAKWNKAEVVQANITETLKFLERLKNHYEILDSHEVLRDEQCEVFLGEVMRSLRELCDRTFYESEFALVNAAPSEDEFSYK